jgi:hypothetical protein
MRILLAITGGFGSGKSEVVNIIKNIHGANKVANIKFAQPLYDLQKIIQEYLEIPRCKDRNLLQLLGTEWGRNKNPDIWINYFIKSIEKYKDFYDVLICDDLRYQNEFKALKEKGFIFVKINRPIKDRLVYLGEGNDSHSSELDLLNLPEENYDYFIENNSSYDDFVYVISEMFMDIIENLN